MALHELEHTSSNVLESPIASFYKGKSILVTGATGFIGKVLIEKLLYSCPELDKIYLLIRGAKGMSPQSRLDVMTSQKPFTMRLKQDFIKSKLIAIDSDLSEHKLGISHENSSKLIERVSIIFHVAASVKFEAPLEINMRHNVLATKELLEFACTFKQLKCFVHVSTAYSNCQLRTIDERIYPMDLPDDPMKMQVTKEMIDNRPNTYTYTKAMAENVASRYASRINIVVVRPSIVMSALKEPVEGWVDTINGPVGLSVLGALGILQKIKVNSEVVFDLIPVDMVTNALVSIAWATVEQRSKFLTGSSPLLAHEKDSFLKEQHQHKGSNLPSSSSTPESLVADGNNKINDNNNNNNNDNNNNLGSINSNNIDGTVRVFNLTTGAENPCSFYHYFSVGREEAFKRPSSRALRPLLHIPKQKGMNQIQYWIHKVFSHLLFAYIIDILLGLFGQKKMVIKAVNRMHHANEVFDYFCSNQWHFVMDNVKLLRELQSPKDKVTFACDVRTIDWNFYAQVGWLGCRRFILKEDDSTFDYAKRRYRLVCLLYYMVKIFLLAAITILAKSFISSTIFLTMLLMPIYGVVYLL